MWWISYYDAVFKLNSISILSRMSGWSVHSVSYVFIRLGHLRWVPIAHCAGRRGLNLLTAANPVELAPWHCQSNFAELVVSMFKVWTQALELSCCMYWPIVLGSSVCMVLGMMTLWHGNVHWWISFPKSQQCVVILFSSLLERSVELRVALPVDWNALTLMWRQCNGMVL